MSENQTNLTLRQRRRMAQAEGTPGSAPKRGGKIALISIGLLILIGGIAWAILHFHHGTDPRLQEVIDLQANLVKMADTHNAETRNMFHQMWEKTNALPDDLKAQAMRNGSRMMLGRLTKFFAMSNADQMAALDKRIAMEQAAQAMRDLAGAQPPPPPGGPGHGGTDAQHVQHFEGMLADVPPEGRAQFTLYHQMLRARMQQQGVTSSGGFLLATARA